MIKKGFVAHCIGAIALRPTAISAAPTSAKALQSLPFIAESTIERVIARINIAENAASDIRYISILGVLVSLAPFVADHCSIAVLVNASGSLNCLRQKFFAHIF